MRVVLDANVLVSALLSKRGTPQAIVERWKEDAFELLISDEILAELRRVLHYPKIARLHGLSEVEIEEFLALLRDETHLIVPTERLDVSTDGPDNRYIECAVAGGAEFLVTGDKRHLLPLKEYEGVTFISPAAFLAVLLMGE